ncbi:hypothetical protein ACG3RN_14925 [Pseudomonas aeruginosa]
MQETLRVILGTQGLLLFVPFGQRLVWLDAALGEHGAIGDRFQRVAPLGLQEGASNCSGSPKSNATCGDEVRLSLRFINAALTRA